VERWRNKQKGEEIASSTFTFSLIEISNPYVTPRIKIHQLGILTNFTPNGVKTSPQIPHPNQFENTIHVECQNSLTTEQ
jgi:hypothetical protein